MTVKPGPSTAKTAGVLREDAEANGGKPEPPRQSADPWKQWAEEREAWLAKQAAERRRLGIDPWHTDQGKIPRWREPPRWWREDQEALRLQELDLLAYDAMGGLDFPLKEPPTMADAFLAEAERLRASNPRQDLPPAVCAVELAERHARATGKPPTEGDVARCAAEILLRILRGNEA